MPMSGMPSEMADHPTKTIEDNALFGEGRSLNVLNSSVFASSPAMKPHNLNTNLSLNTMKRSFEETHDSWTESAATWDMRSPENVDLEELDGMFDDF